ncbi:MAG: DUF1700 domain-containing protein [Coriobacteriia bacterium]|nr:DUF1700 domain-containing protein [Coriobacteriia bacterium]MCL2537314.1 DUF1700 domain-containing protein [Coriobacteriia bacterium]
MSTSTQAPATKLAFLAQLEQKLKGMPESEIATAISYYDEYLSDAGPENEAKALAQLGSPAEVAAGIMGDYVHADATSDNKTVVGGLNNIWVVIIGIFAAPIALPMALAIIALIFSLLMAALSVVFSFFVTAAALVLAGLAYLGVGFFTMATSFATGLLTVGIGLVAMAIGSALLIVFIWALRQIINGVAVLGAKLLQRWNNRNTGREVAS